MDKVDKCFYNLAFNGKLNSKDLCEGKIKRYNIVDGLKVKGYVYLCEKHKHKKYTSKLKINISRSK